MKLKSSSTSSSTFRDRFTPANSLSAAWNCARVPPRGCTRPRSQSSAVSVRPSAMDCRELVSRGAVNAIAQTADGYLWIGTDKGLLRFDGFTFSPVSFAPLPGASNIPILQLLTDPDGQLWIRPEGGDIVRQNNGQFESVQYGARVQTSQITAMSKDSNGRIVVSDIARGTFRFDGSEVEQLAEPAVLSGSASPPIISMAQ